MQTLNLTPAQLNHLKQHGSLWVWMVMKEQPIEVGDSLAMPIRGIAARGYRPFRESDYPFRLGERVEYAVPKNGWKNDDNGLTCSPTVVFETEYATLTTSPEPRRLDSITEEEAEAAGTTPVVVDTDTGYGDMRLFAGAFKCEMLETHPDLTPSSYGWWFQIEKEN